jgi:hypothetical protein
VSDEDFTNLRVQHHDLRPGDRNAA